MTDSALVTDQPADDPLLYNPFDPAFRDISAPVSLRSGMTVRQALDAVAAASNSFYQVIAPDTIIVVTDTPAKRREYLEEVVRQFTVQNVDLKEAVVVHNGKTACKTWHRREIGFRCSCRT